MCIKTRRRNQLRDIHVHKWFWTGNVKYEALVCMTSPTSAPSAEVNVSIGPLLLMSSALPISQAVTASRKREISFAVKTCHIYLRAQRTQRDHQTDDNQQTCSLEMAEKKRWKANAKVIPADTLKRLSNEHNDAAVWWLQRGNASCNKKTVRGSCSMPDWQILLITQCAHCSVWCGQALVVEEVSGCLKHQQEEAVKPRQIPFPSGKAQREQPGNVTVTKHRELCHCALAGAERGGHLPSHGGGLPWLGNVQGGNAAGLGARHHTNHFSGVIGLF